jgi:hypothetical protein
MFHIFRLSMSLSTGLNAYQKFLDVFYIYEIYAFLLNFSTFCSSCRFNDCGCVVLLRLFLIYFRIFLMSKGESHRNDCYRSKKVFPMCFSIFFFYELNNALMH